MTQAQQTYDKTPKYTVKQVAEMMGLSVYTVRYYDNEGLIPDVGRTATNARVFSDYNIRWFKVVHCLRATGLSIESIRDYISMCAQGDSTIPQRAELIFKQEKVLREQFNALREQMKLLKNKKEYYRQLLQAFHEQHVLEAYKNEPEIVPNRDTSAHTQVSAGL